MCWSKHHYLNVHLIISFFKPILSVFPRNLTVSQLYFQSINLILNSRLFLLRVVALNLSQLQFQLFSVFLGLLRFKLHFFHFAIQSGAVTLKQSLVVFEISNQKSLFVLQK
jgi:hypothetical protein